MFKIGNLAFIQLADLKFKVDIPASADSNNISLITLPFSTSHNTVIFCVTPLGADNKIVRLRVFDDVITPWWSSINVTSGEGYCGNVIANI